MAKGADFTYKMQALFEAAYDEKTAKQVEARWKELSEKASNESKEEFIAAFKSFGNIINDALKKLNIQPINLENMINLPKAEMFSQLGVKVGEKFSEGFKSGISGQTDEALQTEIRRLETQKEKLLKRQRNLPKAIERYEILQNIEDVEEGQIHAFTQKEIKDMQDKTGGTADELATGLRNDYDNLLDSLEKLDRNTNEYYLTLLKTYEAAEKLYKMKGFIDKNQKLFSEDVLFDYDYDTLQGIVGEELLASRGKDSHTYSGDFAKFVQSQDRLLEKIPSELDRINKELTQLKQNTPEIIDKKEADNGLKTLNEIEEAYLRIWEHGRKKLKVKGRNIEEALNFDPSSLTKGIRALYNAYAELPDDSPWEVEYQALVKYVKLYESLSAKGEIPDNPQYKTLYDQLKPMAANAENMLRNVLNRANNIPFVGMGGIEAEDVDNAKQIADEAQRKAQANKESVQAAQEEKSAKDVNTSSEPRSLAQEYGEASDKARQLVNALVALNDEQAKLKEATSFNFLEGFDKINPSQEHQQLILNAFNEYKRILQEISNMPVVETEDDKQRLLELQKELIKTKGVLGHAFVPNTTPEEYSSRYGLSAEDAQSFKSFINPTNLDFLKVYNNVDKSISSSIQSILNQLKAENESLLNMIKTMDSEWKALSQSIIQGTVESGKASSAVEEQLNQEINLHKTNASAIQQETQAREKLNADKVEQPISESTSKSKQKKTKTPTEVVLDDGKIDTSIESSQMVGLKKDVEDVTVSIGLKTQAFKNEATEVQKVVDAEIEDLTRLENKITTIKTTLEGLVNNIKSGENDLSAGLSNVVVNVNQSETQQNDSDSVFEAIKTSVEAINNKIQDADSTDNKIAIDETSLETTLNRVFNNILHPQVGNKPIEETGLQPVSDVETGKDLATESTLSNIKNTLDSIDGKIVKGSKANVAPSASAPAVSNNPNNSQYFAEKITTQIGNLAKLHAELETTGRLTDDIENNIQDFLNNLSKVKNNNDLSVWNEQFKQFKTRIGINTIYGKQNDKQTITSYKDLIAYQKIRNRLELQYEGAQDGSNKKQFYEDQLRYIESIIANQQIVNKNSEYEAKLLQMQEEHARKLGELHAKQADNVANKNLKDKIKDSRKEARVGQADSVYKSGQNTIGLLWKIDEVDASELDSVKKLNDALKELHKTRVDIEAKGGVVEDDDAKQLQDQTAEVMRQTEAVKNLISNSEKFSEENSINLNSKFVVGQDTRAQLEAAVQAYTNGKARIKEYKEETQELIYEVKEGEREFTTYTAGVRNTDNALRAIKGTTKRAETFFESMSRKFKELLHYFSASSLVYKAVAEIKKGIGYVREIDSALTELKKVTDETEASYDKFLKTAAKTGARIGSTISDFTQASATFAKLGYDINMASEMAEAALVYQNVGDNVASADAAAESIISTMKGFGLEASDAMVIVDKFNKVGNEFSITSTGIGEALTRSASALSAGGNSLDESIGLITAANEVVQDPTSVGTALKTKFVCMYRNVHKITYLKPVKPKALSLQCG